MGGAAAADLHSVLRPEQRHRRRIGIAGALNVGGERRQVAGQICYFTFGTK